MAAMRITIDTFGAALKAAREHRGVSQARLAWAAGYDRFYVSRLESDSRAPTRDAVLNLADAMGCGGAETDELLMAAGFLPERPAAVIGDEPVLMGAYELLASDLLPADVQEDIRAAVRIALREARRAVASSKRSIGGSGDERT